MTKRKPPCRRKRCKERCDREIRRAREVAYAGDLHCMITIKRNGKREAILAAPVPLLIREGRVYGPFARDGFDLNITPMAPFTCDEIEIKFVERK